jgi:hypothetical protein
MKVTREVVTDLLPVYFSDEASPDTKQLIESFFREDPEFARLAKEKLKLRFEAFNIQLPVQREAEALARTKRVIRLRSWLMAFAIFFTLTPFTTAFTNSGITFFMWRDAPLVAACSQVSGIGLWMWYYLINRRLRRTSL